jgi:hypothetical protein
MKSGSFSACLNTASPKLKALLLKIKIKNQ